MKYLIDSFRVRKLNKRERVLLIILGAILMLWISNEYVFKSQAERIVALEGKKIDLDKEITEINTTLENEDLLKNELSSLKSTIVKLGNSYLPDLNQSQLIYYLEDLFISNELEIKDLQFSEIELLDLEGFGVEYMKISIPFNGKYENLLNLASQLKEGPFRLFIESLFLGNLNNYNIEGELLLRVYSLSNIVNLPLNSLKLNPRDYDVNIEDFNPFKEAVEDNDKEVSKNSDIYDNSLTENTSTHSKNISNNVTKDSSKDKVENTKFDMDKVLIYDFNSLDKYDFLPSEEFIEGSTSIVDAENDSCLRFEYYIPANDSDGKRASIHIPNSSIKFKYPETYLYLRVKSFAYGNESLGVILKTHEGEELELTICQSINWVGWKDIEFSIPNNLSFYPLELTDIYIQTIKQGEEIGVLLFDKLEAKRQKVNEVVSDFYIVEEGDSLRSIAVKIYGSDEYANDIMKDNNLASEDYIGPGKVLVIRRR